MKTYFLKQTIQSLAQNTQLFVNEEGTLKAEIYSRDTDYQEKAKCWGQENFTSKSWVATEDREEAEKDFKRWIKDYVNVENIIFEEVEYENN